MRVPRTLLLVPLLMLVSACAADPPQPPVAVERKARVEDGKYTSEEGNYIVRFPKDPSIANKELATSAGVMKVQTAKVEGGRDLMLSVSHMTYPASFGDVDAGKILDGVRDGLKGQDGELKSDKPGVEGEDKFPARDVLIHAGKNGVRARLVLVDRRLIQVLASGSKEAVEGENGRGVLQKFRGGEMNPEPDRTRRCPCCVVRCISTGCSSAW